MALRLCGQAKQAAREIGRSPNSVYKYRKLHPDFARRWDEAIAEQQREWIAAHQARLAAHGPAFDEAGGGRLEPGRDYAGGWDARKRGLYLRTLARTKRVDAACEAAGVSAQAVSALRARSPRFAAACEKALTLSAPPSVIAAALARAVEGWEEPILYAGQVVAHRRRYSDGLLRDLLRAEQARAALAKERAPDHGNALASIRRKIEAIVAHDAKQAEAEQNAAWDRWRQCWQL